MLTPNVWVTVEAAFQLASPAWAAVIEQVPTVSKVTDVPLTVHTEDELELKLTSRPEEAVAPMVTGDWASVLAASAPNVIDWSALAIVTVWLPVVEGVAV